MECLTSSMCLGPWGQGSTCLPSTRGSLLSKRVSAVPFKSDHHQHGCLPGVQDFIMLLCMWTNEHQVLGFSSDPRSQSNQSIAHSLPAALVLFLSPLPSARVRKALCPLETHLCLLFWQVSGFRCPSQLEVSHLC
jgi:hypothetical protein